MRAKQRSKTGWSRREILQYGLYSGMGISLTSILGLSGCGKKRIEEKPNIVLIILDTTRADSLSCYGYERKTSPNIDKLAEEAVVYTQAIAPSSWTLPSHASLFTGKFTTSHGARYDPEGPLHLVDAVGAPRWAKGFRARGLADSEVTMADILRDAGYQTAAVVGGPWLKRVFGLAKGFKYYDDSLIDTLDGANADKVTDSALKWINQSYKNKFFLFLNYFDPHAPYDPPGEFLERLFSDGLIVSKINPQLDLAKARYDGEIFFMDYHVGRIFEKLNDLSLFDSTWIIVAADHGELIGEHGKSGHGNYLYQQEIHIPLMLKYPAGEIAPRRTNIRIQLNDVFAIILNRLGIPLPENVQAGLPPQIPHPVLSETYPLNSADGHWRAIIKANYKCLWNSEGKHQLFAAFNKGGEDVNLLDIFPQKVKMMLAELDDYVGSLPPPGPAGAERQLDQQTRDALRSLGYVE